MIKLFQSILKRIPISDKFKVDSIYNLVSFVIAGVCGILLPILISRFYDASAFGVFNQVYSIYVLISQFAVMGIQASTLKHIAEYTDDPVELPVILWSGIMVVSCTAIFVSLLAYVLRGFWGYILQSPAVSEAITYSLPGLFFFSVNKVFMTYHNARRHMKLYAVFYALRFVYLISSLILLIYFKVPGPKLSWIFSIAEFLLFMQLIFTIRFKPSQALNELQLMEEEDSKNENGQPGLWVRIKAWSKQHFYFGLKASVGLTLAEANTRVDVLMLGIFASDKVVGIYSFAAALADAFNQLSVVFRTNVNPIITKYFFKHDRELMKKVLRKGKRLSYAFMVPIGLIAIAVFPTILKILKFDADPHGSWMVFTIYLSGILIASGFLPFQLIFNQIGFPGTQTFFYALIVLTNVGLNAILIPFLGMYGAAAAVGLSTVSQVLYMEVLLNRSIGIRI